jgi:hypothetical protein
MNGQLGQVGRTYPGNAQGMAQMQADAELQRLQMQNSSAYYSAAAMANNSFAAAANRRLYENCASPTAESSTIKLPKETDTVTNDKDVLPDISLTRVLKWAIVLIVAMGLGKRVWDMFGNKISSQLQNALGSTEEK